MDASEGALPLGINPNNFPAKLWRLVNSPAHEAICWDSLGEFIVIDQKLFEAQILSPNTIFPDSADGFKTTNFSSFVRQLNLYGFRKVDLAVVDSVELSGDNGGYHYFHNPNFKRDHPELIASLKRLTADNKAKLQAGLSVNCRPPSRLQRLSGGDDGRDRNTRKASSSLHSPTHQEAAHPYYSTKAQAMTAHNGTPVPPRFLIRSQGAVFAADKGMPLALNHHHAGLTPGSNTVHIQQNLVVPANPGSRSFSPFYSPNAQFQPAYYSSVCQCCQPNLLAHMTGSGLQTGPLSSHSYYQATYAAHMMCYGEPHNEEHQEEKRSDINLDTIFQIADEVMKTPTSSNPIKVMTPQKQSPVSVPPMPASVMQANLSHVGTMTAVSCNVDLTKYEQEESVLSVPEQMPEDAIFEVARDGSGDSERKGVKVSGVLMSTSQAHDSSYTGITPNP